MIVNGFIAEQFGTIKGTGEMAYRILGLPTYYGSRVVYGLTINEICDKLKILTQKELIPLLDSQPDFFRFRVRVIHHLYKGSGLIPGSSDIEELEIRGTGISPQMLNSIKDLYEIISIDKLN